MPIMVARTKHPDFKPAPLHLRERRPHAGLTQEQVAVALETSAGQISHLENGGRRVSNEWLSAYAEAIGAHPEQLYRRPHEPSIDAIIARLPAHQQKQILAVVRTMADTPT